MIPLTNIKFQSIIYFYIIFSGIFYVMSFYVMPLISFHVFIWRQYNYENKPIKLLRFNHSRVENKVLLYYLLHNEQSFLSVIPNLRDCLCGTCISMDCFSFYFQNCLSHQFCFIPLDFRFASHKKIFCLRTYKNTFLMLKVLYICE